MEKTFVFGVSVEGDNFTDRTQETKRIRSNFENGVNTILISPRRIGKTSLVKKVCSSITVPSITTRNLVKNRACTGVCQGIPRQTGTGNIRIPRPFTRILNILGNKAKGHRAGNYIVPSGAGNYIVPSGKNSPEKASAHRHLHRRIPTDRRIPRFAHRPETPARLMAAPAVHLILSLWKQKAYDGEHLSEQAHAVLHVRRHILPEAHSDP